MNGVHSKVKRRISNFESTESRANLTEDSSDNFNSDIESVKTAKLNLPDGAGNLDDSNDSSFYERDATGFISASEKKARPRQNIARSADSASRIQQCLDYIHRILSRKDKDDFFQYPVTDLIAPGYSSMIKKPMDFSTLKRNVESGYYYTILEYRDDFVLMCENAMTYNKSDTIYYHAAKKLLDSGLKLMNKDKLLSLRRTLVVMRNLTSAEIGYPSDEEADVSETIVARKPRFTRPIANPSDTYNTAISKSIILKKLEALNSESMVSSESLLEETHNTAKAAHDKLKSRFPNGQMGFLRRNSNGTTSLNFLNQEENKNEKQLTIGNLCEGLDSNLYSMSSFTEDKKNKAKPIYYLENGPFSSTYDSTLSNLSKQESDLLMSIYSDETACQYSQSLMEFSKDSGTMFDKYVNFVLNTLTNNEHDNYLKTVEKPPGAMNEAAPKNGIQISEEPK